MKHISSLAFSLMLFLFLLMTGCSKPSRHEMLTQSKWRIVSSTDEMFTQRYKGVPFTFSPDGKWSAEIQGGSLCRNKGNWHFEDNETKIVITCVMNWAVKGPTEEQMIFNVIRLTPKNLDLNRDAKANNIERSYQISLEAE